MVPLVLVVVLVLGWMPTNSSRVGWEGPMHLHCRSGCWPALHSSSSSRWQQQQQPGAPNSNSSNRWRLRLGPPNSSSSSSSWRCWGPCRGLSWAVNPRWSTLLPQQGLTSCCCSSPRQRLQHGWQLLWQWRGRLGA